MTLVTLALVIGANTTIFSLIYGILFRRLPYPDSSRLVLVWNANRRAGISREAIIGQTLPILSAEASSFTTLAGFTYTVPRDRMFAPTIWGTEERVSTSSFTSLLPSVLGVGPVLGRTFSAAGDVDHSDNSPSQQVILSYRFWAAHYGADKSVLGKPIILDDHGFRRLYTVVGVMPDGFDFPYPLVPDKPDLWIQLSHRSAGPLIPEHSFLVIGRLKPTASLHQAQAELATISSRIEAQYPAAFRDESIQTGSLGSELVRNARSVLTVLLVILALVLLIGAANTGNLLLVRSVEREREMALRAALGADRYSLVRHMLIEAVLLSLTGALVGVFVAGLTLHGILAALPRSMYVPRLEEAAIDFRVMGIAALISMLVATIFASLPSFRSVTPNLKETAQPNTGVGSMKLFALRRGSPLLISAIALTVVLVTGAMLLVKSIDKLIQVNESFAPERLLSLEVSFSNATALSPGFDDRMPALFREFRNNVESLPGVESVALSDQPLLTAKTTPSQFKVTGGAEPTGRELKTAEFRVVTPNYFQMMGMMLVRGRLPADTDDKGSAKVAVVNSAMARLYGSDPIGRRLSPEANYGKTESYEIIGVVSEPRRFGAGETSPPTVYVPFSQRPLPHVTALVRTKGNPQFIVDRLRSAAVDMDPGNMVVGTVTTGEDLVSQATARTRITTLLLSILSAIALLLAIVGIYGFVSYHTAQRTSEIAIRAALGGSRTRILTLVLRQGLTVAIIGTLIGMIGAYAFAKSIAFLLYDVPPMDWATFGAATCLFLFVAAAASLIPALRAIRLDPIVALRHE